MCEVDWRLIAEGVPETPPVHAWTYALGTTVAYRSAHAQTLEGQPWDSEKWRIIGRTWTELEGAQPVQQYLIQRCVVDAYSRQLHRPVAHVWAQQLRPWEE